MQLKIYQSKKSDKKQARLDMDGEEFETIENVLHEFGIKIEDIKEKVNQAEIKDYEPEFGPLEKATIKKYLKLIGF